MRRAQFVEQRLIVFGTLAARLVGESWIPGLSRNDAIK
jgi:hypothetical protein